MDPRPSSAEWPNFRVAGRQSPGKLRAKAIHLNFNIPTSIPAKISTILVDEKVNKGFGSTAFRFRESVDEDTPPGPGTYKCQGNPKFAIDKRGGTGGFASKTDRFKFVVRRSPAPDAYQRVVSMKPQYASSPTIILRRTLKASSLHSTASVIRPNSGLSRVGPGSYDPRDPRHLTGGVPSTAAFRSQTVRTGALSSEESTSCATPAPGTYDIGKSLIRTHAPVLAGRPNSHASSRGVFVDSNLRRLPETIAKEVLAKDALNRQGSVGPGSYNPRLPSASVGVTSVFAQPEGKSAADCDDFDDGEVDKETSDIPGPGSYNPQLPKTIVKVNVAASAFRSKGDSRPTFKTKNPNPGPCYYKPRLSTVRESFINNAGNRWL